MSRQNDQDVSLIKIILEVLNTSVPKYLAMIITCISCTQKDYAMLVDVLIYALFHAIVQQRFCIFQESWLSEMRDKLKEKANPRDVAEAEDLLKQHGDLADDIYANREK